FGGHGVGSIPAAAFDKFRTSVRDFLTGKADDLSGGYSGGGTFGSGGAEQWRDAIVTALEAEGFPTTEPYIQHTMSQIMSESGGIPNRVQEVIDVNSGGNEALGLVQVTPRTAQGLGLAELGGDI